MELMSDHPSDSELADMGDAEIDREDYPLVKADLSPPQVELPLAVKEALMKADEELRAPPPLQRFQFTIRDMLVLTAIVAFLMGLIVSIARGQRVYLIYSIFFFAMTVAWFVLGLWKAGYWRKPEILEPDKPPEGAAIAPPAKFEPPPWRYSAVDLFLMVSALAFLMSLTTLLPGESKLGNAAGILGICTFLCLPWLALSDNRHPLFILMWWLMFAMYLLTSVAVLVMR
jgi:hypothetical protein